MSAHQSDRRRLRAFRKQDLIDRVIRLELKLSEEIVIRRINELEFEKMEKLLRDQENEIALLSNKLGLCGAHDTADR